MWKRRQNSKLGDIHLIFAEKIHESFNISNILIIQPENNGTFNSDFIVLQHFDSVANHIRSVKNSLIYIPATHFRNHFINRSRSEFSASQKTAAAWEAIKLTASRSVDKIQHLDTPVIIEL